MKNYVDIATKIQLDNNYTFKKKEEIEFMDEAAVGNISRISHMNPINEISQFNHNNISVIQSNKDRERDFNLVTDMIPLTNPNNLSVHSNFNYNNESKISQDKNSSFTKYLHIIPKNNTNVNNIESSGNVSKVKELSGQQNGNVKNFMNDSNSMAGNKENFNLIHPLISFNPSNPINSIVPRKSDINTGHLNKFITKNMIDENSNLILKGSKLNKPISSQGGVRNTSENQSIGLELNSYRDRSISAKQSNSFSIPNKSDLSPNRLGLIRNLDPSSNNNNMLNNSPKFLPTFSHHTYNLQSGNVNSYLNTNSNSKNVHLTNDPNNLMNGNNPINYNSNQISVKKITKVFDYNKPPPIKKGMFSYSKPSSSSNKLQEENTKFDLNTFASTLNYNNKTGSGYYNPYSNYNDLNLISKQLAALQNNEIPKVSSQSLLDNSNLSLVDKYQVKKDLSNPNLNKSDNISNIVDETDKISVNSMKSASSINFNKYKVGMGAYSTSKITTINDNSGVSDLSTLIKYENSTNNANYGKLVMNDNNSAQVPNKFKKLASTQISPAWRENYKNQILSDGAIDSEESPGTIQERKASNDLNTKSFTKSVQFFTNKDPHERESRRMQIELLKMKMKERIGKGGHTDIKKVLQEMKLNPLIIDKPVVMENFLENDNSLSSSPVKNKTNLENDPRIKSILKRGKTLANTNDNIIKLNQISPVNNLDSPIPNSDSASSYINTIKSTAHLNYSLEEDSNDKIMMLCFLVTPRILYINVSSNNKQQKIPFIFQLIPSNSSHKYGFEHYSFQWNDFKNLNPVGMVDVLKINSCSIKSGSPKEVNFVLDVVMNKSQNNTQARSESVRYDISANSTNECILYVNALNFISQLVKCKAYAHKGNEKQKV